MSVKMTVQAAVIGVNSITPNFSMHERGVLLDPKDVGGNFIIDLDGNVLKGSGRGSDITITVIGGINNHVHRKDSGEIYNYYMNEAQKNTVHAIAYRLGVLNKYRGQIKMGNDQSLYQDFLAAFENGRG
jgi:hypothetical protein